MLDATFVKTLKPSEIWDQRPALERFLREAGGKARGSFKIPLSPFLFASLFGVESPNLSLVKEIVSYILC